MANSGNTAQPLLGTTKAVSKGGVAVAVGLVRDALVVPTVLAGDPADALDLVDHSAARWVSYTDLKVWDKNPRRNDPAVPKVAASIQRFGFVAPVVVWTAGGRMVAGHTRLKAMAMLCAADQAFTAKGAPGPGLVRVVFHDFANEAEADLYALADNRLQELSTWDDDGVAEILSRYDEEAKTIAGWGVHDLPSPPQDDVDTGTSGALQARFGVPPFSVLDARQGYWQERKRAWLALGIRSEEGRDGCAPGGAMQPADHIGPDGKFARGDLHAGVAPASKALGVTVNASEGKYEYMSGRGPASGGSIFDPVLVELLVRWFAPPGGTVLDPFAGGSVRGIVCAALGRRYVGIELRADQVTANAAQWDVIGPTLQPVVTTVAAPVACALPTISADAMATADLATLTTGFRGVTADDQPQLQSYLDGFAKTRSVPRFYTSTLALAQSPKTFLVGVVGGCLVVLKRRTIMKNRTLYLIVPPMSPTGDVKAERAVLDRFHALGVGAKLSADDLALYGIDVATVTEDAGNAEFVYRAGDAASMAGSDWSGFRNKVGHATKVPGLQVLTTDRLGARLTGACVTLTKEWRKERVNLQSAEHFAKAFDAWADAAPGRVHCTGLTVEGAPVAYGVTEHVSGTHGVIACRFKDYARDDTKDPMAVLHHHEAAHWAAAVGPDMLLNFGAGVGEDGLEEAKRRLHPQCVVQIYSRKPPVQVSEADYLASCQPVGTVHDFTPDLTPVQAVSGGMWLKRDDLFAVAGVRGGKVRSCWALAQAAKAAGAEGIVTAGSRSSPQVNIVAHVAARLGLKCRVHTPQGEPSPEVAAAVALGADLIQHKAGYNNVIIARAREDAAAQGWPEIPFGMECDAAITATRSQVANVPSDCRRLVVPVGSGMSLAGILHGLRDLGRQTPVVGVVVGSDPKKRLAKYAPDGWEAMVTLVPAGVDYHVEVQAELGGVLLDPVYEAKCVKHLQPGDCLWVVGIRQTAGTTHAAAPDAAPVAPGKGGTVLDPTWVQGDSNAVLDVIGPTPAQVDFVFTCPPYADLEVYSDDPADISNMPYDRFLAMYRSIIAKAVARLRHDRFAAIVVGDVRAPDGTYRNLVSHTIQAFEDAGAHLYNEAILVTSLGSIPIRAGKTFQAGRKLGKTHQNVLVFVKGDGRAATLAVGDVDFGSDDSTADD